MTTAADLEAPPAPGTETALPLRKFSVDEYHRMGEAGILAPRERVELLDGVIYQMSPIGPLHNGAADRLAELLHDLRGRPPRWQVRAGGSIALLGRSEPLPDVALLRRRPDFYRTELPGPADVLLLVEVADTSLDYDRHTKAPRYARAGIVEFWILNLVENAVEVYRQPDPATGRYLVTSRVVGGEALSLVAFPEVSLPVANLLGAAGASDQGVDPGPELEA